MRIPARALILIGDGEKALFLRNQGTEAHPRLDVERVLEHADPASREQGSDRPGRYMGPDGHGRSAVEEVDWHSLEKDRFAREMAQHLYRMAHARAFEDLVLVAPPRVLGELRQHLHPEVADKVRAELTKDLTMHPIAHIVRLLTEESA